MSLTVNKVSKQFDEKIVLNAFSYSFKDIGLYVIKGESGIGKTTLLRMIAGLDTDYQGEISGGGIENVSFMFQEYRLFPTLSALKNASAASNDVHDGRAAELLIKLGFEEADLKKKPKELSGGMKQRVAFVRALIKDAPILILDEPTKELDSETAGIMLEMIKEEANNRIVIVVTHDNILGETENSHVITL